MSEFNSLVLKKTKRDQDLRDFLMSIPGGVKKQAPQ